MGVFITRTPRVLTLNLEQGVARGKPRAGARWGGGRGFASELSEQPCEPDAGGAGVLQAWERRVEHPPDRSNH